MIQRQHTTFEEQEGFDYFYLHKKHFLNEGWFLNVFEEWKEAKNILEIDELLRNEFGLKIHPALFRSIRQKQAKKRKQTTKHRNNTRKH